MVVPKLDTPNVTHPSGVEVPRWWTRCLLRDRTDLPCCKSGSVGWGRTSENDGLCTPAGSRDSRFARMTAAPVRAWRCHAGAHRPPHAGSSREHMRTRMQPQLRPSAAAPRPSTRSSVEARPAIPIRPRVAAQAHRAGSTIASAPLPREPVPPKPTAAPPRTCSSAGSAPSPARPGWGPCAPVYRCPRQCRGGWAHRRRNRCQRPAAHQPRPSELFHLSWRRRIHSRCPPKGCWSAQYFAGVTTSSALARKRARRLLAPHICAAG